MKKIPVFIRKPPKKVYKSFGSLARSQEFHPQYREKHIMTLLDKNKSDALIRKGNFANEIIWGKKSFIFPKAGHKPFQKGLFLFGMVRRDAREFLLSDRILPLPKKYPTNEYNNEFFKFHLRMTGTDCNHAYWRIAYNLGIIRKTTYLRGLGDEFKVVRLVALSTMGSGREYMEMKDGQLTGEYIKVGVNEDLAALYKLIRYTCYRYMQKVKKMLAEDFVGYRTDCVYYVDTQENRKMVRDFFRKEQMEIKQLIERNSRSK